MLVPPNGTGDGRTDVVPPNGTGDEMPGTPGRQRCQDMPAASDVMEGCCYCQIPDETLPDVSEEMC